MAKSDTIYKRLSSKSSSSGSFCDPAERSPSLISFVGQTGAGKSTLIKLLLESHSSGLSSPESSPVIGVVGKHVPTSEHVHLYLDPTSSLSQAPLLYADCEGLDGGEREPVATSLRIDKWQRKHAHATMSPYGPYCIEREIHWAKSRAHRTRNFAVSSFYPRVLFTFSDVIVFVHRNARYVE
jgi:energy-coupling factor transporter ATP-binding protein EcfA2